MDQEQLLQMYLDNPNYQNKYSYNQFASIYQRPDLSNTTTTGIGAMYNNLVSNASNMKDAAKSFIQNKIASKFGLPQILPGMNIANMMGAVLPQEDPVVTATRDYYAGLGQDPMMEGYNPVSGGGLYTLTGGQFGEPPTLGLDNAYQKRIDTIQNVGLKRLEAAGKDTTNLTNRLNMLQEKQAMDRKAMNLIKNDPNITQRNLKLKLTGGRKAPVNTNPTSSQDKGAAIHGSGSKTISYSAPKSRAPRKTSASLEAASRARKA